MARDPSGAIAHPTPAMLNIVDSHAFHLLSTPPLALNRLATSCVLRLQGASLSCHSGFPILSDHRNPKRSAREAAQGCGRDASHCFPSSADDRPWGGETMPPRGLDIPSELEGQWSSDALSHGK